MSDPEHFLLTDIEVDEISLVDDPGNQHSWVSLMKRRQPGDEPSQEEAFRDAVRRGVDEVMPRALEDFVERMVAKAKSGALPWNPEAAAPAASSILEALMDIDGLAAALETAEAKMQEIEKSNTELSEQVEALTSENEEIKKSLSERDAEISKLKKASGPVPTDEEVIKALPEPVRKMLDESRQQAAEATAEVSKLREEREHEAAVAKARAIGFGDPAVLGPLLVRVSKGKTTPEDAATLEQLFTRAQAVEKGSKLFTEVGSPTGPVAGDEEQQLNAKAAEIAKANPKMTKEAAYAAAVEQNPQLYNAYVEKRRAK